MPDRSHRDQQATEADAVARDDAPIYPFELHRVVEFLRSHNRLMVRGAFAGLGLAVLFLLLAAPVYTAQTQVLLDPALPRVIQDEGATPTTIDSQKVETELAVLRSEEISLAAIKRLGLADDPEFAPHLWIDRLPEWAVSDATRERAERQRAQVMLENFRKDLNVRRVGVSYAIDIFYTAADPDLAARIANGIAEAYVNFQIESRSAAARVGTKWLEQRLIELRSSMNAASRDLQRHRASQDYSISTPSTPSRMSASGAPAPTTQPLTLEELESTAATYRRVYENFLGNYMAATQRQSFPISSAQIITRATPPLSQSRSAILVLVFASLLGACGGAVVGALNERRRSSEIIDRLMSYFDLRRGLFGRKRAPSS